MKYGIFSDIHGNLEALGKAFDFYKNQNIDDFICLGDIVGYGANPVECLNLIKKINPKIIAGNHDWASVEKFNLNYFNWQAKEAILWTQKKINKNNWKYLKSLPLRYKKNNFYCVHGDLEQPREFHYIINSYQAQINFSLLDKQICFIGHSHLAGAFCQDKGEIQYLRKNKIKIAKNKKYIINVGSIGQPRDGDPRSSLCIYDTEKQLIEFIRIDYNIKKAANKITKNGLPEFLAQRLYVGQ